MRMRLVVPGSIVLLLCLTASADAGSAARSSGMPWWGNAGSSSFTFGSSQSMAGQGFAFGAPVFQSRPVQRINPFVTREGVVTVIGPNRFVVARPLVLQPLPFHCNPPVAFVPFHRNTVGIVQRRLVIVDRQQFVFQQPFAFQRPLVGDRRRFVVLAPPREFADPPGLDLDWDLPVR